MRESLARAPSLRPAAASNISAAGRLAKRLLDLTVALPCLVLAAPLLLAVAVTHPADHARAGPVPPDPAGPGPAPVRALQVPDHVRRLPRRRAPGVRAQAPHRLAAPGWRPRGRVQARRRCQDHAGRQAAAAHQHRRASPVAQRHPGRHVTGRAPPGARLGSRDVRRWLRPAVRRAARPHRPVAGERQERAHHEAGPRPGYRVRGQAEPGPRPLDSRQDHPRRCSPPAVRCDPWPPLESHARAEHGR